MLRFLILCFFNVPRIRPCRALFQRKPVEVVLDDFEAPARVKGPIQFEDADAGNAWGATKMADGGSASYARRNSPSNHSGLKTLDLHPRRLRRHWPLLQPPLRKTVTQIKKAAGYLAKASKPAQYVSHQEMKELMQEQVNQISSGVAAALGPLVQSQQMLQHQLANTVMASSAAPSSGVPQQPQQMPVAPQSFNLWEEDDTEMVNPNAWDLRQ